MSIPKLQSTALHAGRSPFKKLVRATGMFMACALALFGTCSPSAAAPRWEVPAEVSQGRAFFVKITDNSGPFLADLLWQGKTVHVYNISTANTGVWEATALLAMPLDAKGSLPLVMRSEKETLTATVKVRPVAWPQQKVTVEPKYVEPSPEAQAQIARDTEHNKAVLAGIGEVKFWDLPFQKPVPGSVSGVFGSRRVFNGQPRSPHKGTDLRGAQGTPVLAMAAGVVALAEPQYFSGNVIYLDHGQGVFSLYAHLSAFDVKVGDKVEKGQIIGKVGATGRVTGPHLHLGFVAQGVSVDALPLFDAVISPVGGPSKEDPKP